MTAQERRRVVETVQAEHQISERKAVCFTGFSRSSVCYQSRKAPQTLLREKIRELAHARPHWGYRRLHVLLLREGWTVNRKRV